VDDCPLDTAMTRHAGADVLQSAHRRPRTPPITQSTPSSCPAHAGLVGNVCAGGAGEHCSRKCTSTRWPPSSLWRRGQESDFQRKCAANGRAVNHLCPIKKMPVIARCKLRISLRGSTQEERRKPILKNGNRSESAGATLSANVLNWNQQTPTYTSSKVTVLVTTRQADKKQQPCRPDHKAASAATTNLPTWCTSTRLLTK